MARRTTNLILCALAVACTTMSTPVYAQDEILQKIPPDALGFVVVNNVQQFTTRLDQWIKNTGLDALLGPQMPQGSLDALKTMAMLGEGFNPDKPFAVVMLDPLAYGVKLPGQEVQTQPAADPEPAAAQAPSADNQGSKQAMDKSMADQETQPAPTEPAQEELKLPFVLLVPGDSIQGVFGNYEITAEDPYSVVHLRMGPMFATQQDGWVMLSPLTAALDAMQHVASPMKLSENHRQLLGQADIGMHVNMVVAQPIISALADQIERQMHPRENPQAQAMTAYSGAVLGFYRGLIAQVQDATAGINLGETGLVVRKLVTFLPDSNLGKTFAAYRQADGGLLNRLPDNQFILAFGFSQLPQNPDVRQFQRKAMADMLAAPMFADMTQEQKDQLLDTGMKLSEQLRQGQFVLGGVPGPGIVGLAYVLEVQDAQQTRQLIQQILPLYQQMMRGMGTGGQTEGLTIQMAPLDSPVDGMSVDAIRISQPDLDQATSEPQFEQIMGQTQLELYLATPSDKLVVITMGGGTEFLSQAVKTAVAAPNQIATSQPARQALEQLPPNHFLVGLFSLSGVADLIARGAQTAGASSPFQVQGQAPLALGLGAEPDGSLRGTLYVPNDMVKDVMGLVMQFMMGRMGGPPGGVMEEPAPGAATQEDF